MAPAADSADDCGAGAGNGGAGGGVVMPSVVLAAGPVAHHHFGSRPSNRRVIRVFRAIRVLRNRQVATEHSKDPKHSDGRS